MEKELDCQQTQHDKQMVEMENEKSLYENVEC